ncbi:Tn3 family transposase [Streptomyces sp. NBC_01635]|uniref:Tn3 family transposase n=1 Tax=Streptomyces sp. NBC_01635 TaxID=2975904 RepID=UPI003865C483|nr:Tn3 family transposase [Streptomyces sp. NBC_01635]
MTSIERTAYPRFKRLITARELHVYFTPAEEERAWAEEVTDSDDHQLALLLALKSYQRLGCFPKQDDVPEQVVEFVRRVMELPESTLPVYASGRTAERHRSWVRERCGVRYDGPAARALAEETMRIEAASKNNPADLINIALEKLVEAGLEIPRFSTLDAMASTVRGEVNEEILAGIRERMTGEERRWLLRLPDVIGLDRKTLFNALKQNAGRATWSNFKRLKDHLEWVDGLGDTGKWLEEVAPGKVANFAGEAEAQDAATLKDYTEAKRVALMACLAAKARMRARDDIATMFCKRMAAKAKKAREELEEIRRQQQEIVEALVGNYRTLLQQVDADGPAQKAQIKAATMTKQALDALEGLDEESTAQEVTERLEGRVSPAFLLLAEGLMVQSNGLASLAAAVDKFGGFDAQYAQIEKVSAHHGDNWEVLLHGHLKADRPVMYDLSDVIELKATSEDSSVLDAVAHAKAHRTPARDYIPDWDENGRPVDISFATQNWRKVIRDRRRPGYFVRRHFEAMVFYYLAEELRTGDVAVIGSEEYADWSEQLLSWNQVEEKLPEYLVEVGLREAGYTTPFDGRALVAQLRRRLSEAAAKADGEYPENDELFIEPDSGAPKLKARRAEKPRKSAQVLEQAIKERMPERSLLGIVARTAYWIEWWRRFGPASGNDPKLKDPFGRYVITTFVKGTNMTFAEAARHIASVTTHELSIAARRHTTLAKLNEAVTDVVNAHAKLDMSRAWGNGTTAAADGTHMDTYLDNLLAETSVRYGAVGGIAYHHISDLYIALFTHFVPCGVWEAVYIIEGLLKNTSEIKPTTIHADTQGQSYPVFSLAYLLGIDLMPRIRNWKDLLFFRPSRMAHYEHIDVLFGEPGRNVIDWGLIETHFKDLMRVTVSVREGAISSTLLLKRLRSGSHRNATYTAFREVGRVIRTIQLLRYLSDAPLRARVTAATNKVEAFNGFSDWVRFGQRGTVAVNDPVEQEKDVKFTSLLANLVIFHNTLDIADVVRQLQAEGQVVDPLDLAQISPYLTEHIMRFGEYSTHELGVTPDDYDAHLDVDFSVLGEEEAVAA